MRHRALLDLVLAAIILLLAVLLPNVLKANHPLIFGLIALSAFSLTMAGWRFSLFLRRQRHDQRWLQHLEGSVAAGGTIFD